VLVVGFSVDVCVIVIVLDDFGVTVTITVGGPVQYVSVPENVGVYVTFVGFFVCVGVMTGGGGVLQYLNTITHTAALNSNSSQKNMLAFSVIIPRSFFIIPSLAQRYVRHQTCWFHAPIKL